MSTFFEFELANPCDVEDSLRQTLKGSNAVNNPVIIACLNPHSFVVAQRDVKFHQALSATSHLICDGFGLKLFGQIVSKKICHRFTGPDLFDLAMGIGNEIGGVRVFFLGGSDATIHDILQKAETDFPSLVCGGLAPPFRASFSTDESAVMIQAIKDFNPDILWVGMSAPKQEKWVEENRNYLKCRIVGSVGAVFDFYTDRVKRAPKLFRFLGCEWLWRSLVDPKRLGKRNLVSNPVFVWLVLKRVLVPIFNRQMK